MLTHVSLGVICGLGSIIHGPIDRSSGNVRNRFDRMLHDVQESLKTRFLTTIERISFNCDEPTRTGVGKLLRV